MSLLKKHNDKVQLSSHGDEEEPFKEFDEGEQLTRVRTNSATGLKRSNSPMWVNRTYTPKISTLGAEEMKMDQFGSIPFAAKLHLLHTFFIIAIVIQIFDITVIISVFFGELLQIKDFDFNFWMQLEILSELFKSFLLIVWFTHVARKKEEFNDQFELIEPPEEFKESLIEQREKTKTATFAESEVQGISLIGTQIKE